MKNLARKFSFITMLFLMFTIINFNHVFAADGIVYGKFTGKITVMGNTGNEGTQETKNFITVKSTDDTKMNFYITASTMYLDKSVNISFDSVVTCFYDKNENPPFQYYTAIAIVDGSTKVTTFLSKFDDNLLSENKDIVLIPDSKTEIITPDGEAYTGDIKNHTLLVFSTKMTSSCPAKTAPLKIIVMDLSSAENKPVYDKFTGIVIQYTKNKLNKTVTIIVQAAFGDKKSFIVDGLTYIDGNINIKKNSRVVCFYDNNEESSSAYTAIAIAKDNASYTNNVAYTTIKTGFLGRFDKDLIDDTNSLKLINTNKATIISANGKKYTGSLQNRVLLVFYNASFNVHVTEKNNGFMVPEPSNIIPDQISPLKIVVM